MHSSFRKVAVSLLAIAPLFSLFSQSSILPTPSLTLSLTRPDPRYLGPRAPDPRSVGYDPTFVTPRPKIDATSLPVQNRTDDTTPRTVVVHNPNIPGIQIVKPSQRGYKFIKESQTGGANGFVIRNGTLNRHIKAVAVTYTYADKQSYMSYIDGLTADMDIGPGETIATGPAYLKPVNQFEHVSAPNPQPGKSPILASVAYMLFDDGTFFGPSATALQLEDAAKYRRKMLNELRERTNKGDYIKEMKECADKPECSTKYSGNEWSHRHVLLDEFLAVGASARHIAERENMLTNFPGIKYVSFIEHEPIMEKSVADVMRQAKPDALHPDAPLIGWYINRIEWGTCNSQLSQQLYGIPQGPAQFAPGPLGLAAMSCMYPVGSNGESAQSGVPPMFPIGILTLANYAADARVGILFTCAYYGRQTEPTQIGYNIDYRNYSSTLLTALNVNALAYNPRSMTYDNIFPVQSTNNGNFNGYTIGILTGLPEAYNEDNANLDGGTTTCNIEWLKFHPAIFNVPPAASTEPSWSIDIIQLLESSAPIQDGGTLFTATLTGLNIGPFGGGVIVSGTSTPYLEYPPEPFYGVITANVRVTTYCGGATGLTYYKGVTPSTQPVEANTGNQPPTSVIICEHTPPAQASNSGPGSCDPGADYCCCMAAFGDSVFCGAIAPENETPACGVSAANAQSFIVAAGGAQPPSLNGPLYGGSLPTLPPPTAIGAKIGVARQSCNPSCSTQFLLDSAGVGTYIAGVTEDITTFIPPNGVQSYDVPLSGDWVGSGHTSIGYYRSTTGQWFLDANGNGIWDGVAGGDYLYTFGGLQQSFTYQPSTGNYIITPADVPVVGDWHQQGKTCIGVFRQGFSWLLDINCNGVWDNNNGGDSFFAFGGEPSDVPVVMSAGANTYVGVVRCYIPQGASMCQSTQTTGQAGWPGFWVWDGSPTQPNAQQSAQLVSPGGFPGIPAAPFWFGGLYGDLFVTGDWRNVGQQQAGIYRSGSWLLDYGSHVNYGIDYVFGGLSTDLPLVGKW